MEPGYEKLCCLRCVQTKDTDSGATCICRVPGHKLADGTRVECQMGGYVIDFLILAVTSFLLNPSCAVDSCISGGTSGIFYCSESHLTN